MHPRCIRTPRVARAPQAVLECRAFVRPVLPSSAAGGFQQGQGEQRLCGGDRATRACTMAPWCRVSVDARCGRVVHPVPGVSVRRGVAWVARAKSSRRMGAVGAVVTRSARRRAGDGSCTSPPEHMPRAHAGSALDGRGLLGRVGAWPPAPLRHDIREAQEQGLLSTDECAHAHEAEEGQRRLSTMGAGWWPMRSPWCSAAQHQDRCRILRSA